MTEPPVEHTRLICVLLKMSPEMRFRAYLTDIQWLDPEETA